MLSKCEVEIVHWFLKPKGFRIWKKFSKSKEEIRRNPRKKVYVVEKKN